MLQELQRLIKRSLASECDTNYRLMESNDERNQESECVRASGRCRPPA